MEWASTRPLNKLVERAETINSRIILAFDLYPQTLLNNGEFLERAKAMLASLKDYIVAVKIGLPTIMSIGLSRVKEIIDVNREYYYIADVKFADIGFIGKIIVNMLDNAGFDAIITHSIIGVKGALEDLVDEVRRCNGGVFALCAMSHEGAEELLNRHFKELVNASLNIGIKAFILPATMPKYIREVRRENSQVIIASPGIGAQGAMPGSAIAAGADFEIIGRAIYNSKDPVKEAEKFKEVLKWKA